MMQGIMSYLLGGEPSSPPASRAAEQEEINIAMALSLSEPAPSETPLQDDSQVETENDQAIAKALATTVEINSIPTTPTEKPELPIMAIHPSLLSMPIDLQQSLKILQEDEKDGTAVAGAMKHEEVLVAPTNIEVASHYDTKIESKVSKFRLPSMKAIFYPSVNNESASGDYSQYKESKRRLKGRLETYTLMEYEIAGDGNCQFGSLSDQLYRTPKLAGVIRAMVVKHLRAEAEQYSRFVPGDYDAYCEKMEKNGTWGDHLTLQAAANRIGVQINLITSYKDTPFVEIFPTGELKSSRILWLSFFGELHYNSLYTHEDIENRRKMDRPSASDCILF